MAHPLYATWTNMRRRCENPSDKRFASYGGRGIKVCDRWKSFEAFASDMGEKPSRAHSLDRINNDGDYEPENCRWALPNIQRYNKSSTLFIVHNGQRLTVPEIAAITGVRAGTVRSRIMRGLPVEAVMAGPDLMLSNPQLVRFAEKAKERAERTHCLHGHEYTEENTYWFRGKRHCRACQREKDAKRRPRRK